MTLKQTNQTTGSGQYGMKSAVLQSVFIVLAVLLQLIPDAVALGEEREGKTLIIYYSRTGKSKLVCDVLQKNIHADILEVKDTKGRYKPGRLGYYTAGFNSVLNRYTPIETEFRNFSSYASIIIVSPVWNWKLSVPIRTFIQQNRFDGRKMIFITTANNEVTKYEKYGDDAPFVKKFFRDYLRKKCAAMKSFVKSSGCVVAGYYHVPTFEKTDTQIIEKTLSFVDNLKNRLSLDTDPLLLAVNKN